MKGSLYRGPVLPAYNNKCPLGTLCIVGIIQDTVFLYRDASETPSRSLKSGRGDKISTQTGKMHCRKLPRAKTGTDDTLHEFRERNDHFPLELSIGA